MWKISVPFARIMAADATYTKYLSEKQAKEYKKSRRMANDKITDSADEFAAALGIPSF